MCHCEAQVNIFSLVQTLCAAAIPLRIVMASPRLKAPRQYREVNQNLFKYLISSTKHPYHASSKSRLYLYYYQPTTHCSLHRRYFRSVSQVMQHRHKEYARSFTAQYNCDKLVWFELFPEIAEAIHREKQVKAGNRKKKLDLVNFLNPEWKDLWETEVQFWEQT